MVIEYFNFVCDILFHLCKKKKETFSSALKLHVLYSYFSVFFREARYRSVGIRWYLLCKRGTCVPVYMELSLEKTDKVTVDDRWQGERGSLAGVGGRFLFHGTFRLCIYLTL